MINVTTATTRELVDFYNERAERPVKKFADRKTAERRVQALIDEQQPAEEKHDPADDQCPTGFTDCPDCGIHLSNGWDLDDKTGVMECLGCGHQWHGQPAQQADETRAEAQRRAWANPEVKAARSRKQHVLVDGEEYRSVKQAFEKLNLPLSKHIKFRGELKALGVMEAFDHNWMIVDKGE